MENDKNALSKQNEYEKSEIIKKTQNMKLKSLNTIVNHYSNM